MTNAPTPLPRALGEAENALRATLLEVISGSGLDYEQWVALQLTSNAPGPLPASSLTERISSAAKIETAKAESVIAVLGGGGWLSIDGDHVELGARGNQELPALKARTVERTQALLDGIDPEDIATAARVLATIAERASASLA
jgi:hypothetical protein